MGDEIPGTIAPDADADGARQQSDISPQLASYLSDSIIISLGGRGCGNIIIQTHSEHDQTACARS